VKKNEAAFSVEKNAKKEKQKNNEGAISVKKEQKQ
jgi:hypothetical protein